MCLTHVRAWWVLVLYKDMPPSLKCPCFLDYYSLDTVQNFVATTIIHILWSNHYLFLNLKYFMLMIYSWIAINSQIWNFYSDDSFSNLELVTSIDSVRKIHVSVSSVCGKYLLFVNWIMYFNVRTRWTWLLVFNDCSVSAALSNFPFIGREPMIIEW